MLFLKGVLHKTEIYLIQTSLGELCFFYFDFFAVKIFYRKVRKEDTKEHEEGLRFLNEVFF